MVYEIQFYIPFQFGHHPCSTVMTATAMTWMTSISTIPPHINGYGKSWVKVLGKFNITVVMKLHHLVPGPKQLELLPSAIRWQAQVYIFDTILWVELVPWYRRHEMWLLPESIQKPGRCQDIERKREHAGRQEGWEWYIDYIRWYHRPISELFHFTFSVLLDLHNLEYHREGNGRRSSSVLVRK